jgi:23S rRNA pseudouridine1911/1915/1917 synthase
VESTRVEVVEGGAGKRLDRFLADQLGVSRARVRHLLEVGRVRMGERTLGLPDKSHSTILAEVFDVDGSIQASDERPVPRPDLALDIVAQGAGWLVVNKPVGCGVHPLRPDQEDTVLNAVIARHPEIMGVGEGGLRSGVVHRLDVETTGALVFATTENVWKRLRGAFSEHRVQKRYLALVAGRFEAPRRLDVSLIVKQHRPARVEVVSTGGHACRQWVTPKRVFSDATLVEVDLETGFLHQIRATLAHVGHPILGDSDYIRRSEGRVGGVDAGEGSAPIALPIEASRPLLHSARLTVDEIAVTIDPPADFAEALDALEELEMTRARASKTGDSPQEA